LWLPVAVAAAGIVLAVAALVGLEQPVVLPLLLDQLLP